MSNTTVFGPYGIQGLPKREFEQLTENQSRFFREDWFVASSPLRDVSTFGSEQFRNTVARDVSKDDVADIAQRIRARQEELVAREAAEYARRRAVDEFDPRQKLPNTTPRQPELPNKMAAADVKWGMKSAWDSKDLFDRQQRLETFSSEVALLISVLRKVVNRVLNKDIKEAELKFYANFGAPIQNNIQTVSLHLTAPIVLILKLTRELRDGNLHWIAQAETTPETPLTVKGQLIDLEKINSLDIVAGPGVDEETTYAEQATMGGRRRVRV